MNPRFGRRTWVKLWVNEWLEGTTRCEMSDAQRAFFIDLLAMAGRSRFPGIVCAGQINGKFVGYPITKFQSLMTTPINVQETLELFERNEKVKLTYTQTEPFALVMVELLKWEQYQSEYQRQKPYRLQAKLQESDKVSYVEGNKTDTETDTDTEVEKPSLTTIAAFWELYPVARNKKAAERTWNRMSETQKEKALEALPKFKASLQWRKERGRYVPYAQRFLGQELYLEAPDAGRAASSGRSFDERSRSAEEKTR
jgi:hypothetical protein